MKTTITLTGGIDVGNSDTKSYLNILDDPKEFLNNTNALNSFPSIITEKKPGDAVNDDLIISVVKNSLKSNQGKLPDTQLKAAVELYFESNFITAHGQLKEEMLAQNKLQKQVQVQLLEENEKLVDELTLVKKENESIKAEQVPQVDKGFSLNAFSLLENELMQLRLTSQLVELTDKKLNLLYMIINDVASQPKTSRYLDASNFDRSELVSRLNRLLQI